MQNPSPSLSPFRGEEPECLAIERFREDHLTMCGFAGVIAWDEEYRTSDQTLRRMSAAIAHRGPDGEGQYINHHDAITRDRPQVALAFRRLAILDPDPRSNQPFTDGRHWLVFNGEIYNFRELRQDLTALDPGHEWRTTGDTEVLLRAYAIWGEKCVEHLNGMFAFAVWDSAEKSLFLARDRMGQKPLYYAIENPMTKGGASAIAFASELSALTSLSWVDGTVDNGALSSYLRWAAVPAPLSIYRGARQLLPSNQLNASRSEIWSGAYFSLNDPGVPHENPVGRTRELLLSAAKRQVISDVPIGCFLSGGIDSSVTAFAVRQAIGAGRPLRTFSIGFEDPRYDEREYAAAVAGHLGTEHRSFQVRPDAANDLPGLAKVFAEPFGDSSALPTHYLARETRRHVKVALSGDGGDELFGGYDRYRAMMLGVRLQRLPEPLLRLAYAGARQLPGNHPKARVTRLRRLLSTLQLPPQQRYASYLRLFDEAQLTELYDATEDGCKDPDTVYANLMDGKRDLVQLATATDRMTYLPNDLLTKVDRASMLHALEVRSPFMDHELVQFAAGLTTDQLLKGGPKRMLREAFAADLPDFVFKRKKMGFAVPIGEWFRGELRPMLRDSLFASNSFARGHFNMPVVERLVDEHEQLRIDHSQRLYALLMLELWWNLQRQP